MKVKITVNDQFLKFHGIDKDCYYYATKTDNGCIVTSDIGEKIEIQKEDYVENTEQGSC